MESCLTENFIPTYCFISTNGHKNIWLKKKKTTKFFEVRMNQINTNLVTSKYFNNELIAD